MNSLSAREKSLVSFGAAIGCNCIPCTVYHLKACRENGVTDEALAEALRAANAVKDVPASNVTQTALRNLKDMSESKAETDAGCCAPRSSCGCQ